MAKARPAWLRQGHLAQDLGANPAAKDDRRALMRYHLLHMDMGGPGLPFSAAR